MKKIILATLIGTTLVTLYSGCSSLQTDENGVVHSKSALYTHIHNDKKLKQLVIQAAKDKGWRVTNFKEKSIIAEKFGSDTSKATTITIQNGVVDFDNMAGTDDGDIVDLKEYIEDLTNAKKEGY